MTDHGPSPSYRLLATLLAAVFVCGLLSPPAGAEQVSELIGKLGRDDNQIRRNAALALGELGSDAQPAIPALRTLAGHDQPADVRLFAQHALDRIYSALVDQAVETRQYDQPVDRLLASPDVRDQWQELLWETLRKAGPAALPALKAALFHEDAERRKQAVVFLGKMRADAQKAAPELIRIARQDESESMRQLAIRALDQIGVSHARIFDRQQLICRLEDREAHNRLTAARALGELGPEAKSAIGPLQELLADPLADVRQSAAQSLWQIQSAVVRTARATKDYHAVLQVALDPVSAAQGMDQQAWQALQQTGSAAVPALKVGLSSKDPEARTRIVELLREVGPDASPATAELLRLVRRDEDPQVRQLAVEAINRIGIPEGKEDLYAGKHLTGVVIPALVLEIGDAKIRRAEPLK